jgi:hypothetical protein
MPQAMNSALQLVTWQQIACFFQIVPEQASTTTSLLPEGHSGGNVCVARVHARVYGERVLGANFILPTNLTADSACRSEACAYGE